MSKVQRLKKKVFNYFFDHPKFKLVIEYLYSLVICTISAAIFSFGFAVFAKGRIFDGTETISIITGGASGVSQSIRLIIQLAVGPENEFLHGILIEAIFYSVVNVPLIIFAFRKIGIRFALFTCINVGLSSLLMPYFNEWDLCNKIATHSMIFQQPLVRTLFAGFCTGLSSAIAFKGLFSTGGLDIVGYYMSLKKSSSTGKYTGVLNVVNVIVYTLLFVWNILTFPSYYGSGGAWVDAIISLLYGFVYLAVVVLVVDLINVRNKKVQIQIVTNHLHLSDVLIANFPHSVTITKAIGGYSHKEKYILMMVVSSFEVKKVVRVVRLADSMAFVQVASLNQVYGKFFINPIK